MSCPFCVTAARRTTPAPAKFGMPSPSARRKAGAICGSSSISASTRMRRSGWCSTASSSISPAASAAAISTSASGSRRLASPAKQRLSVQRDSSTDPVTGQSDGLLERLAARRRVPKIFFTNSSTEYWRGDASLIHTDAKGHATSAPRRAPLPLCRNPAFRRHLAVDRHQPARRRARPAGAQFGRLQAVAARPAGAHGAWVIRARSRRRAAIRALPTAPP